MPRAWYRFTAAQADAPDAADLYIFDVIGKSFWDDSAISAEQFLREVRALPESVKTIRLHISSPGGNPFDAVAIANTLRTESRERGRRIEVSIEGLAASAASVVAMAGDTIRIADNALMMIHESSGFAMGPKSEMRAAAEMLDSVDRSIVATYRWHATAAEDEIAALMAAVTWMNAEEAVAQGFATELVPGMQAAAQFRPEALARLGEIPETYRARVEALSTPPPPAPLVTDPKAVIRACTAAGVPELAEDLLGQPMDAVTARLAHATEIRSLCAMAKLPELAPGYLRARTPADVVRAHLTTITAKLDARTEINGHLSPDERASKITGLVPATIYAARNKLAITKGERT